MNRYAHWTADSGTMELPSFHRGLPLAEAPTSELWMLDLRPSVPKRVARPNRWQRFRNSPAMRHLRAATSAAYYPAFIGAGLLLAVFVLMHVQALTPVTGGIR